jgi:hypothetical protein
MFKIEGKFLCGYILALSLFFLNEIFISRIFLFITLSNMSIQKSHSGVHPDKNV